MSSTRQREETGKKREERGNKAGRGRGGDRLAAGLGRWIDG